uniref:Uncharacterized protein n=1 Tax=Macrostomum lignano TaxID=282301 RepID=A0A1I8IXX9_9PLAT
MCIEKTAIQLLGRQKQYVPPTTEATAAWQTAWWPSPLLFYSSLALLSWTWPRSRETSACSKPTFFYLRMRLKQL